MNVKQVLRVIVMVTLCLGFAQQAIATGQSEASESDGGVRTLSIIGKVDQEMWDTRENQASWLKYEEMLKSANLNLDIEAIAGPQWDQVLQTRLAASKLPDLVMLDGLPIATIINLGKNGVFRDVLPLVEKYSNGNWQKMDNKYKLDFWGPVRSPDEKAYFLPSWVNMTAKGNPFFSLTVPMIRYDWLQKLGLPLPTTIDELSTAMKAFREQDVNENGKQDEVLLWTPGFTYFAPFFGLPAGNYNVDPTDSIVKSPWFMKDKLIPYIEWLQDMVNSGVLSTDALGKSGDYTSTMIKSNIVGTQTGFALTGFYDIPVAEYGGSYLGVVTPKDPDDFYVQAYPPASIDTKTAITRDADDPVDLEAAIDLFDLANTDEFGILFRFGVEGISHTVENGMAMGVDGLSDRDFDLSGKAPLFAIAGRLIPTFRSVLFEQFYVNLGTDPV
ncbi:MAG: hypothetical protein HN368_19990, partial [Spirochaetales bacterium]|nr:hypothetical protein [Spirochaetales bacterium]